MVPAAGAAHAGSPIRTRCQGGGGNQSDLQRLCVCVEQAPFEQVVAYRYDALRRTAFLLTGDHGHAEDLVQVVLVKAHRSWSRVQRADDLDAYLHMAVINAARSWRRRLWHGERPTGALPEPEPERDDPTGPVDLRQVLVAALRTLPTAQKEALALRYLAGLSEEQAASRLGVAAGTVKSRVSRGLAALRASGLFDETEARR